MSVSDRRTIETVTILRRVDSLTALRGLAAWLVVLTHCLRLGESLGIEAPAWLRWLDLGNFAVLVFFCLSGFTLILTHERDRWDATGWTRFLTRRVFRVYPSFLASFVVCLAAVIPLQSAHILPHGTWIGDSNRIPDPAAALAILSFTANVFGIDGDVNNVFWSLPIEFQFYLLFPILALLLQRSAVAALAAAAALAVAGRLGHWPGQTADLAWIFVGGMVAGWLFARRRTTWPPLAAGLVALVALVPAIALSNTPHEALRGLPGPLSLYFGVSAIAVVMASAQIRRPGRALIGQGEISYSIYLFHTPPILLAFWLVQRLALQGGAALLLIYAVVIPGTWAAATTLHRLVERPGMALGRRLSTQR